MTFNEWIEYGYGQGWCGPAVCSTHDGTPTSAAEDEAWEDGDDPCVHVVRLYEDAAVKAAVESNHSPSVWRWTNSHPAGRVDTSTPRGVASSTHQPKGTPP